MERLAAVMHALGGIASRRDLVARGFSGPQLTAAVRAGLLTRVRQGYYATAEAAFDGRLAVRLGGRLGCLSAMRSYGYWGGFRDEVVHVTLPRNASRLRWFHDEHGAAHADIAPGRRCWVHWRDGTVSGRSDRGSSWRVGLVDALSDVIACAPRADVRAAFESTIRAGTYGRDEAQRLLDAMISRESEPIRLFAGSGSGVESHLVEVLLGLGVRFDQQVAFDGIGRVDFVVEGRLVIEVDGYTFHAGQGQFELDRARDAALLGRGFPVLRIPARVVVDEPELAAVRIMAALAAVRRGRLPRAA